MRSGARAVRANGSTKKPYDVVGYWDQHDQIIQEVRIQECSRLIPGTRRLVLPELWR